MKIAGGFSQSEKQTPEDSGRNLIERIAAAYCVANKSEIPHQSALWNMIFDKNKDVHSAILSGEHRGYVDVMNDPASSYMFYGFDNMYRDVTLLLKEKPEIQAGFVHQFLDQVDILAAATGAKRQWNPQGGSRFPDVQRPPTEPLEELLDAISEKIGLEIDFPNPFPDEFGIVTSRGIVSERAIQAIYNAWRLKTLSKQYGTRILEVGAGLGRTAYYSYRLGLEHYALMDLPFTNLSQANFLGRALSPAQISLFGEKINKGSIRILPASEIESFDDFDILANTDSLTEMDAATSLNYACKFVAHGKLLWSVNHEGNNETVATLDPISKRSIGRFPYWLRPGYLEEMFLVD